MRESIPNFRLALNALSVSVFLLLSACSTDNALSSLNKVKNKNNKENAAESKTIEKSLKHTHPPNPCTDVLEHSHVFDDKEHQHSYDCENTNKIISNAHVHEATKKTRRFRHVHPNGANEHSHHKE